MEGSDIKFNYLSILQALKRYSYYDGKEGY
jgi:hypothetical protein